MRMDVNKHGQVNLDFWRAGIGDFRTQTDQRSDDSNLQHLKGETGRNRYKAVSKALHNTFS